MKDPGRAEAPEYRSPNIVGIYWISYLHAGHLHNLCVQRQCYVEMTRFTLAILIAFYPDRNSSARNAELNLC